MFGTHPTSDAHLKARFFLCRHVGIGGFFLIIRVKVANRVQKNGTDRQTLPGRASEKKRVLTSSYVRELSRGISYRIQQREHSHADSAELAAKARFR